MKKIIIIFIILIAIFSAYRYINYGSVFRSCEYTETELNIIPNTVISVTQDADVVTGQNEYACTQILSKVDNVIFDKRSSNSFFGPIRLADKRWEHIKISNLTAGTELKAIKAVSVKRYGFLSGNNPYLHIIVEDKNGKKYQISIVSLGVNRSDETLSIKRFGEDTNTILTYDNFKDMVLIK